MPSATYKLKDANGRELASIPSVLGPVALTAVATNSASAQNRITVNSTAGVYPGMPVFVPNIPLGSFVSGVVSSTVLELACSIFNRSTGVWSTTGANANATATATGLSGFAYGYHPACIIELAYAMGMWRNQFSTDERALSAVAGQPYLVPGFGIVPAFTITGAGTSSAAAYLQTLTTSISDEFQTTPLKRHNGEIWGVRPFVHTSGFVSHISANPEHHVHLSAIAE
jgi:hypothetical protein